MRGGFPDFLNGCKLGDDSFLYSILLVLVILKAILLQYSITAKNVQFRFECFVAIHSS